MSKADVWSLAALPNESLPAGVMPEHLPLREDHEKVGREAMGAPGPGGVDSLFSDIADGVIFADISGITHCNPAAQALLGDTESRSPRWRTRLFTARHQPRLAHAAARIQARDDPLARALGGETYVGDISALVGNDRQRLVLRCSAAPVRAQGRVVGAVVILTECSARERSESALRHAGEQLNVRARRRARALNQVNHRLKTEIAEREKAEEQLRIVNETLEDRITARTTDLLEYQRQLRSLAGELNRTEERERNRLARALHDNLAQMLALCKIKAGLLHRALGRRKVAGEALALKNYLDEAMQFTRTLMSDLSPALIHREDLLASVHWLAEKMRAHGLEVRIQDDGIVKHVDEHVRIVLFEAVRELLFNILKHSGADKARVFLRKYRESIRVTVSDRGVGFDPASERPAPTSAGGFGLFNVRERLHLIGGSLAIKSVHNGGTMVVLTAPLASGGAAESPVQSSGFHLSRHPELLLSPTRDGNPARGGKIRVVLADDQHMIRDGLRGVIERYADLEVVGEAADGEQAIEVCRVAMPDVVVMDVNMPRLDGCEATRRIREEFPQVAVIGLSIHSEADMGPAMCRAGAVAYLSKDDAAESLCAAIRRVAGQPGGQ